MCVFYQGRKSRYPAPRTLRDNARIRRHFPGGRTVTDNECLERSPRRAFLISVAKAGAIGLALVAPPLRAQSGYPNKPIKLIAPVQPGGGVDLVARTIADRLGRALGQSIVVENMSGGGGVVASQAAARAAPDGYTLMVGYVGTHGTNPAVRKLPYDAIKDFTPIAMVGGTPNVLVVAAVAAGRPRCASSSRTRRRIPASCPTARPAPARSRTSRWSSSRSRPIVDVVHIPYRGIGPAFTDMLGGQTQTMLPGLAAALPHIKAGKVKPLAVTGTQRHPLLPDVPTFDEAGFKGFDGVQWYGDRRARRTCRRRSSSG